MTSKICICGGAMDPAKPFSEHFNQHFCSHCGSQHFVPKNSDDGKSFDYDQHNEKYKRITHPNVRWAHRWFASKVNRSDTVLEIGCYTGFFIKRLLDLGVDAYGVDINTRAIDYGQQCLPVLTGRLVTEVAELGASAQAINHLLMIDFLEHVASPDNVIASYVSEVAPEKITVAGPLNSRALFDRSDFPPHHLWRFSEVALDRLFLRHGFCKRDVQHEYNLLLLLRNLIGRLIYVRARENWGSQRNFERKFRRESRLTRWLASSKSIERVFRSFQSHYAASIMVYERCPRPHVDNRH